jgi:alpha-L-fucosidase
MHTVWKIILVISIILNLIAIWGFYHYIRYGGSPLGELKRMFTGAAKQKAPKLQYAEENAGLQDDLSRGELDSLRVIFLGASITRRWDLEKYFPAIHPINRSVGGQLVFDMLPRFKRDVLDLKPKAVVIKFCSINIRPRIPLSVLKDGMTMMVQLSLANDVIPIISTIIPAGKPEAHIGDFSVVDTLAEFNSWVRGYALENGIALIDYAAAIQDEHGFLPREFSVDPVHLNDKGYDIIAEAARSVIYRAVGVR